MVSSHYLVGYTFPPMINEEERLQGEVDSLKYQLGTEKIKTQNVLLQLEEENNINCGV